MDEVFFKTLKELSTNQKLSQRDLAFRLDVSLGKANYVLKALLDKGYIKAQRFKNSKKKLAYMYVLTPKGMKKKLELTYEFLLRKMREYEKLKIEIKELENVLSNHEKNLD